MSTLMSSREKPRFRSASTADSAATLLLKSAVTNFGFFLGHTILPNKQCLFRTQMATRVPAQISSNIVRKSELYAV